MVKLRVEIPPSVDPVSVLGPANRYIGMIESGLDVKLYVRGCEVEVVGEESNVRCAVELLEDMVSLVKKGHKIGADDIAYEIKNLSSGMGGRLGELLGEAVFVTHRGKRIRPKTLGQRNYVKAIKENDVIFAIGPAGTGKTYLAVACALAFLKERAVSRIILARPAVEAGERLGFLPGTLEEKVNPYLRPLYDALYDMVGADKVQVLLDKGIIEIAPLAYMRGRTLNDAFVILDEAQNATGEQMKMFLTRIGFGSKVVITGDITQIDLPKDRVSGLVEVQYILKGIPGIAFVYLTSRDVVRHPIVQRIVEAYERYEIGRKREIAE